jgi:hypothetical protein
MNDKNFPVASIITDPLKLNLLDKKIITPEDNDLLKYTFKDTKSINNLKYILTDLLQGDNSAAKREEYAYLNMKQIQTAITWLMENNFDDSFKNLILTDPWRLTYKCRPPTPEEFLGPKYIGAMSEFLWQPMKDQFIEFFDPFKPYRSAIFNTSIGSGKSTCTILILLYVATCFALMRNPRRFFSFPDSAVFVFALCAVTISKASEIYIEPIQQMLESADFWKQCRNHQEMMAEDKHLLEADTIDYIPWRPSGKSSVIQTGNGLNWKQISSANSLLGMQILCGCMTEITFFLESGKGWTNEKLLMFFSKLRQRITNRFKNNYYARFILDSSPSTLEDAIQAWISFDSKKNGENLVWMGSRWKLYPWEFPEFISYDSATKTAEEHHDFSVGFQLFKGGNGKPPQVVETPEESVAFEDNDVVWCPIKQVASQGTSNFLDKAKENPIEFMKDFAGIPAGQADRLFYQGEWIENCFNNGLKNSYGSLVALAQDEPEHLIWNQIQDKFWYRVFDKWYYYYEPGMPRVVSVDQSKSKDVTCIAMSHMERDPVRRDEHTNQPIPVYVTDFTIVLVPKGGIINLDAIKFFIMDLRRLGGLNIKHVSFDGYQSEPTKQYLKRAGFEVDWVSVDADNTPYFNFYDLVVHHRWFCGKNIFVKNNMRSLYQARRKNTGSMKIEHFPGDLTYDWNYGDWETGMAGSNAKDTTDAICANLYLMGTYGNEFMPYKVWNPQADFEVNYDNIKKRNNEYMAKNKFTIV